MPTRLHMTQFQCKESQSPLQSPHQQPPPPNPLLSLSSPSVGIIPPAGTSKNRPVRDRLNYPFALKLMPNQKPVLVCLSSVSTSLIPPLDSILYSFFKKKKKNQNLYKHGIPTGAVTFNDPLSVH